MELRRRGVVVALCAASGAAAGLAHLPGAYGILSWVAYAPLLWLTEGVPPREAFGRGLIFGAAAHAVGLPWLFALTRGFLHAGPVPAAGVGLAVCAALGLRWALAAAATAAAGGSFRRAAAFVAANAACEAYWPSFSPSYLAFTQLFHLPTVQCTAYVGALGLAVLVLAFNAAVALAAVRPGPRTFAAAALVAALACGNEVWGRHELARVEALAASKPSLRVAVIQAGSPSAPWTGRAPEDESPRYARPTLDAEAAAAAPVDLVIWPENSYRGDVRYGAGGAIRRLLPGKSAPPPILLNTIGVADDGRTRNVSLVAAPDGRLLGFAEKRVLMPFGEFMPRGLGFLDRVIPLREHLSRGRAPGLISVAGTTLGVAVCFEDVVPGPTAELARLGARLIIAQSNDSWFSPPHPEQHLMYGALRAVENRRALIHAARTGVSAVVWPSGRVTQRLEVDTVGSFVEAVPLMDERVPGPRVSAWLARASLALSATLVLAGTLAPPEGA